MTAPTVSVIVVSRDRPDALVRCLKGLEQLDYQDFEVVVVGDKPGLAALKRSGLDAGLKTVAFEEPNISAARNRGLAVAACDIVAFIDDDAVPEPTWLSFLTKPFEQPDVIAAGGYVRGRNGISFQSTAQTVTSSGWPEPLTVAAEGFTVFQGAPDHAIKTEGTNCAFRRAELLEIGGFDPTFHFYMDETDLNLRLAHARARTAIVPLAQVHHGSAPSPRRWHNRLPRTLFDIGASHTVLLRKHAGEVPACDLDRLRAEQRARLLRHMVAGNCEPRDVGRLLDTLQEGIASGRDRALEPMSAIPPSRQPFLPFEGARRFGASGVLAGRSWQAKTLRKAAAAQVDRGRRTSLFLFSPTTLFHRVAFTDAGVWEQTGGLFGKSERTDPVIRYFDFEKRLSREVGRVAVLRNLPSSVK